MSCPKQFHFQSMWITHLGFRAVVSRIWNQPAEGGGMRALAFKLKQGLWSWNRDTFGNVFDRIDLEQATTEAENAFDEDPSPVNREFLHKQRADLLQPFKQEEIFWKQKARVKWLKEGDSNTRFFHSVVKNRDRMQRISAIRSGTRELFTTQSAIQEEVASFYFRLDCSGVEPLLQCLPTNLIDADISHLTLPLSSEEVKEAVWKLDLDSAAGSDGFSGAFFRSCWDIVEEDVFMAARDFFSGVPLPRAMRCRGANVAVKLDMMKAFDRLSWPFLDRFGFPVAFTNLVLNNLEATRSLKALSDVLKQYQAGFGQKINYNKSFFVTSKHYYTGRLSTLSHILSMQHCTLPFRYLGVNMFAGSNRVHYYYHLLEQVNSRLHSWQRKLLSPGGRLTLIKHVLAMIPLYTMASVPLPKQIEKALESKFAMFFWGIIDRKPKRHWLAWKKLCLPTEEGGLGVRCLASIQEAFSAKLYFNYLKGGTLWSSFMQERYRGDFSITAASHTWRRMQLVRDLVEENTTSSESVLWMPSIYGNFSFSVYDLVRPTVGRSLPSTAI
ncbi:PREDICTED: uncharacterized protein LOC109163418 [Ipomoea nil]|uniref:uncharacterized protein LOC109163418 n=1 Tax=Ipomoea nil TaxID=35883 RepID=UPI000900ECC8|nr:PREDICTED: uncharacterized protein LOC109163418 [Ipomoea nil]